MSSPKLTSHGSAADSSRASVRSSAPSRNEASDPCVTPTPAGESSTVYIAAHAPKWPALDSRASIGPSSRAEL